MSRLVWVSSTGLKRTELELACTHSSESSPSVSSMHPTNTLLIRRQEKRGGWISRCDSTDLLSGWWSQSVSFNGIPRFLPRGGWRTKGETEGKGGRRVSEERTGLASPASASVDVEFTLLRLFLLQPSFDFSFPCTRASARASGQFEITLSPSQCVQSKLQFKSSLARPSSSLCHSCRSTGIRNTENSSSVDPTTD